MTLIEKAPPLTEKLFQRQVLELARIYGWRAYHPFLSKWSEKGFPDLTMVRPRDRRLLFAELKSEKGRVSEDQREWLALLSSVATGRLGVPNGEQPDRWPTIELYVWRPADWDQIQETLR